MKDVADKFIEKIMSLLGNLGLFIILCAFALLLFIFLIVMICQGAKISKLKKKNAELNTALEKERANKRIAEQKAAETQSQQEISKQPQSQTQQPKQEQAHNTQVSEIKWAENDNKTETQTQTFVETEQDDDEYIEVVEEEPTKEEKAPQPAQIKKTAPLTKSTSSTTQSSPTKYIVMYEKAKDSWVIKKPGADRVVRRVATKEEAMAVARELSRKTGASLVVHKKDGKFQKQ